MYTYPILYYLVSRVIADFYATLRVDCLMGNETHVRCRRMDSEVEPTQHHTTPTMHGSWRALRAVYLRPRPRSLAAASFFHLPGRSGLMRSGISTHQHSGTLTSDEEDDVSELGAGMFGAYSVILPPEPFVFGVSHIPLRPIPAHIPRPSYVTPSIHGDSTHPGRGSSSTSDGRVQLGSLGEQRLRRAASLAREVLEYAGTLVKVKAGVALFVASGADDLRVGRHHHGCAGRRRS
jgi:hypothetical protein